MTVKTKSVMIRGKLIDSKKLKIHIGGYMSVIAKDKTGTKLLIENKLGHSVLHTVYDPTEESNRVVMGNINFLSSGQCKIGEDIFIKIQTNE